MRNVKISVIIGQSCRRTAEILFKPFSLKKWLKLLLIALLAGALAGGNGSGGGGNNGPSKDKAGQTTAQTAVGAREAQPSGAGPESGQSARPALPAAAIPVLLTIAGIIIAAVVIFLLIIMWLGTRFRFVWVNSVVNNSSAILEPYSRHAGEANSLFKFSLVMLFIFLLTVAAIGAWVFLSMKSAGVFAAGFTWSLSAGLKIFLMPAVSFILYLIIAGFIAVMVDQFAVPIMAFDSVRVMPALKMLGKIFRTNWPDMLLFLFIELLLGILTSILIGAIFLVALLFVLLLAAVVFGIPFAILWLALKAKAVFIGYAVLAGVPFLIVVVIALAMLQLPFAVFFRALTINYLISLNCGYTQETFSRYALSKAGRLSKKAPIVLMILTVFFMVIFFVIGLFAAIAIPNFIKAKEEAVKAKRGVLSQTVNTPVS